MPLSKYRAAAYTSIDWQIMTEAYRLASKKLNRHAKNHEHCNRLARTIMNFYTRGIRDVGVLSTLAAIREKSSEGNEHISSDEIDVLDGIYPVEVSFTDSWKIHLSK